MVNCAGHTEAKELMILNLRAKETTIVPSFIYLSSSVPISPSRRNSEHFQRCIRHETRVGVPELTLSVDQHALGVLSDVDSQPSWKPFRGVLVHPVAEHHHVSGEIVVVQMTVGVFGRRLSDDYAAVEAVHLLQTGVGVPEVSTGVSGHPLISETIDQTNSFSSSTILQSFWTHRRQLNFATCSGKRIGGD